MNGLWLSTPFPPYLWDEDSRIDDDGYEGYDD